MPLQILVFVIGLLLGKEAQAAGQGLFHPPETAAENALDRLLKQAIDDPDMGWFAINVPWRDTAKDQFFSNHFSKELRNAFMAAENAAVMANCQGIYREGEDCGLGINPIICAQDSSEEGYLYRTINSSFTAATISYRWTQFPEPIATYNLIRQNNLWLLDGVSCSGLSLDFNFR